MATCFVIQPFDRGKFDARYKETFKPAIQAAGFEPYRVDEDFSVEVPIDDIEKGIKEATVCFAEVSINNPNVWYELAYARALKRPMVMVCERDARPNLPFDIQNRMIIYYDPETASGFESVKGGITARLQAITERLARDKEQVLEAARWAAEQRPPAFPRTYR